MMTVADNMHANGNGAAAHQNNAHRQSSCVVLFKSGDCKWLQCESACEIASFLDNAKIAWVNYTVNDVKTNGEEIATALGFSGGFVSKLLEAHYSDYEDNDVELGLQVPAVTVSRLEVTINPMIILMRRGLILTIASGEVQRLIRFSRYADTFFRKIPKNASWQDALTLALLRILEENNDRNFEHLREIEMQADDLSKDLMDFKMPRDRIAPALYGMKHALITYMNVLWATLDVTNSLRYGDAEIITDNKKILERMSLLSAGVTQHLQLSEHMSEVLASGLEVLQTIYNNQLQVLNNRLAFLATWLAIVGTAVLVPNTLATIYGIPSVSEHTSYSFIVWSLIVISLMSTVLVFLVIKFKGWIPKGEW